MDIMMLFLRDYASRDRFIWRSLGFVGVLVFRPRCGAADARKRSVKKTTDATAWNRLERTLRQQADQADPRSFPGRIFLRYRWAFHHWHWLDPGSPPLSGEISRCRASRPNHMPSATAYCPYPSLECCGLHRWPEAHSPQWLYPKRTLHAMEILPCYPGRLRSSPCAGASERPGDCRPMHFHAWAFPQRHHLPWSFHSPRCGNRFSCCLIPELIQPEKRPGLE